MPLSVDVQVISFQQAAEHFFQHCDDTTSRFSPFTFIAGSSIYLYGATGVFLTLSRITNDPWVSGIILFLWS